MHSKAPRRLARLWQDGVRGALLTFCTWLAGAIPAVASEKIISARFTDPTTRYPHGVLGDRIEYGTLDLVLQNKTISVHLPPDRVFEDIAPRMVDIDQNGTLEVVVVESRAQTGAQLAIYDALGQKIASTPHIGTRFRWLAPVGAADLDGDGHIEIAYIDRPHLAKTLRIWRFTNGDLTEIASLTGLTNHKIGEDFISGGLRNCDERPELIVASADWSRIISVSYNNEWTKTDTGPFTGPESFPQALKC